LKNARLLVLIILVAITASAQDRSLHRVSSETDAAVVTPEGGAAMAPVTVAKLPDAPAPHRVADKKFVFVMAALGGAEAVRFTSRKLVLDNEFAAGAPWVTHVQSNSSEVAEYAGLYAAELIVTYEMKKPHHWLPGDRVIRKFWWAYPAAMTAIHVKNGIDNIHTQGSGGCTAIECAMQMQTLVKQETSEARN
jgi:hypothetical protein